MKAVLRIALGYFSCLPLQRWLNGIGAGLMIIGALLVLPGTSIDAHRGASLPLMLGATFIGLTPGFVGGSLMRHASTRMLLQLRPYGRLKLLLGTTLAITMVAILATLPAGLVGRHGEHALPILQIFAASWSIVALLWIGMFIASRSPMWTVLLVWVIPAGIWTLARFVPHVPVPAAPTLLLFAAVVWLAFCWWYAAAPTIWSAPWNQPESQRISGDTAVGRFMSRIFPWGDDASSLSGTRLYLIGTAYYLRGYAVNGVLAVLGFMVFQLVLKKSFAAAPVIAPVVLPILTMTCASLGMVTVGRARLLWLRAGADRAALFALAERQGLRVGMTTLAAGLAAYLTISVASQPEYALSSFLFALSQLAFGICMFYGGLSLTRGWAMTEAMTGLGLLFVVQVIATSKATFAYPRELASAASIGALLVFVLLVPLLRGHALRRWRDLDWRIARLSVAGVAGVDAGRKTGG